MTKHFYVSLCLCLCFILNVNCHGDSPDFDVIILGGGAAAIRAAARLQEHGITNIRILVKSDRLGGIHRSDQIGGYTVELGPGRIWWTEQEIISLANRYISTISYRNDRFVVYNESGNDVTSACNDVIDEYDAASPLVNEVAQSLRRQDYPDISVVNAYKRHGFTADDPMGHVVNFIKYGSKDAYAESLKFRGESRRGAVYAANQDGHGFAKLIEDYAQEYITDFEAKLVLNATVVRITNYTGQVTVYTSEADYITARHLIVAYSLGELRQQSSLFQPPLPDWKLHAMHAYGNTEYIKIYLCFASDITWFIPSNIWRIFHVSNRINHFVFWQNFDQFQPGSHILMGMATYKEAERLRRMTDVEILSEAMAVLRGMFGDSIPDAEEILVPRGEEDPLLHGAFSYWPSGYTVSQHNALKAAVGQVHFAGDYSMGNEAAGMQAEFTAGKMVADSIHECTMDTPHNPAATCGDFVPSYMTRGCTYENAKNYDSRALEEDGSCDIEGGASMIHACVLTIVIGVFIFHL